MKMKSQLVNGEVEVTEDHEADAPVSDLNDPQTEETEEAATGGKSFGFNPFLSGLELLQSMIDNNFVTFANGQQVIRIAKAGGEAENYDGDWQIETVNEVNFAGLKESAIKKLAIAADPNREAKTVLAKLKKSMPALSEQELITLFRQLGQID